MIRLIVSALVSLIVADLSIAQSPFLSKKSAVQIQKDLVFRTVGDKELKLDLALPPEGKGPFPVVICVHGGAWRLGNKRDIREWIEYLAEQGFAAVSISYRLVPDAKWPGQVEDAQTAVRWVRANAEKYQFDRDRIGAMGFSAGGHLACFLGMIDKQKGFECKEFPDYSSKVKCVVNFFGPCDLCYWGNDESAQNAVFEPMFGCRFQDDPECYKRASPINYVSKDAVPFLILHGTEDRLVPIDQSRKLNEKLKSNGVPVKLLEFKGEDHGWFGKNRDRSTKATIDFLVEHLKKDHSK